MSKKRSLVDGALTVTAASRIFTQDAEDMPEELREQPPSRKETPSSNEPLAPNYGKYAKRPLSQIPDEDLHIYLQGAERSINDLAKAKFKAANERMRDAIQAELSKREQPDAQALTPDTPPASTPQGEQSSSGPSTMTAGNTCQQLRLSESIAEASSIMNAWLNEEHSQEDSEQVNKVFAEVKKRLGKR